MRVFPPVVASGFLALTALPGGAGLVTGRLAPGLELLAGSPFADYTLPGIALILVGLLATAATVAHVWRMRASRALTVAAGASIVIFELVEIWAIGTPAGAAVPLQLLYLCLGAWLISSARSPNDQMTK